MSTSTLEKLQAHLRQPEIKHVGIFSYKDLAGPVQCADGSTMSVQASRFHYSTPHDDIGPYTEVEVWHCGTIEAWSEYGDGENPYAYIPIEIVAAEIDRRGGFAAQQFTTQGEA